jgi:Ca-activated chloride channel family protein
MIRRCLAMAGLAAVVWTHGGAVVGQESRDQAQPPSQGQAPDQAPDQGYRFRSGIDLINVTATVSDRHGRFVPGLTQDDFLVYEDDRLQEITQFSAERAPVSLGIALDTSGSMAGEKMDSARKAIDRFLYDLLDREDEIFIYGFADVPMLVHAWTTDRDELSDALGRIRPRGATAMYDAVAEAVPTAQSGRHRKKALVIISDGNDTNSKVGVGELRQSIRETEVLVYAIAIDARAQQTFERRPAPRPPFPLPGPGFPGGGRRFPPFPPPFPPGNTRGGPLDERANQGALRELTDDSGGRTEIVRSARDLDPATASIADELSRQYSLAYASTGERDGRWHTIRIDVRGGDRYVVRARRGYVATP